MSPGLFDREKCLYLISRVRFFHYYLKKSERASGRREQFFFFRVSNTYIIDKTFGICHCLTCCEVIDVKGITEGKNSASGRDRLWPPPTQSLRVRKDAELSGSWRHALQKEPSLAWVPRLRRKCEWILAIGILCNLIKYTIMFHSLSFI
jgi:hypothetical protein